MACGMAPVSVMTGVSEASNRRGHSIPVVGGLASQPLISTFVLSTGCSPTWVMERGPEQSRGRFMGTLSYRGHTYKHQPAAAKVCKQLSCRGQEYNACTEQQPADLHPHLSYRGIGYDKSLEADEECRLRNDRQSYFLLARRIVRAQFQFADESRTQ